MKFTFRNFDSKTKINGDIKRIYIDDLRYDDSFLFVFEKDKVLFKNEKNERIIMEKNKYKEKIQEMGYDFLFPFLD